MSPAGVRVGDVLHFFHPETDPPKPKFSLCISPNLYFCINSKKNYPGSFPILESEYDFLKHDSFIACHHAYRFFDNEIPGDSHRGELKKKTLEDLRDFLPSVRTLVGTQIALYVLGINSRLEQMQ